MRQKKSWEDICVSPKFFIYLWHLSVWFMNLDIAFIEGLEYINTSYVTSMNKLFYGCSKLTQLDDFWKLKTDLVVSMSNMFYGCHSLASIELKATNTANVTNMSNMFSTSRNHLTEIGRAHV